MATKKPALPPEEPPIPKATQEAMKLQAAQEKADRKQAEEQKAGEKEVKDNMGRLGFKKGGSASSRADGCAIRGKTRA
jgi:ubiquitin